MLLIPEVVKSEDIREFVHLLLSYGDEKEITVDLSKTDFIEIAPILLMLSIFKAWSDAGKSVLIRVPEKRGGAFHYMRKMNFFNLCGISPPSDHSRGPEDEFSVPLKRLCKGDSEHLSELIAENVSCSEGHDTVFTDQPSAEEIYEDALVYSLSELMRNVEQHSQSEGFVGAQKYDKSGRTQVTIADNGIGIRESFFKSGSPHSSKIRNDMDALDLALTDNISSKTHGPMPLDGSGYENAGAGLAILRRIIELAGGEYTVISGRAIKTSSGDYMMKSGLRFKGTFVQFSFISDELTKFNEYIEKAKQQIIDIDDQSAEKIGGTFE